MRNNRKLISVVCALAMIMSVFASFVIVNAATEPTLKVVLVQAAEKTDDIVKLEVQYAGVENLNLIPQTSFTLKYDETKFEFVGAETTDGSADIGDVKNTGVKYAGAKAKGFDVSQTIATIELKLTDKDPSGEYSFDLVAGKLTDETAAGDDVVYTIKNGNLKSENVSFEIEKTITGPRFEVVVVENPKSVNDIVKVEVRYAGIEEFNIVPQTSFTLKYDVSKFEFVSAETTDGSADIGDVKNTGIKYAGAKAKGFDISKPIATIELKLIDESAVAGSTYKLEMTAGKITDETAAGDDVLYTIANGLLAADIAKIVVDGGSIDPTPTPSTDPTPTPTPSTDPTPTPDMDTITGVKINPETTSVEAGGVVTFTATVEGTGTFDKTVKWSMTGASSDGTTLVDGTLTVAATETSEEIKVTATSVGDATKSATATVNVNSKTEFIITETTETVSGQIKYTAKIVKGELPTTVENIVILAQGYKKSASGKLDQPVAYTTIENVKASSVGEDGLEYSFTIFGAEKMNITVIDPATGNPLS